ncbi:hypothetical protein PS467_17205 [Streptomyces luomodiensis]|uniref:Glycosyltransferase RgtA/B/C/D-like domain-containing protein n=1 Tax=Streptomyces luomodiensis TaxID=3026192 RepID=A0ABY9V9K9_9ACTN|nr:hypothetical protein [Streptomyces sp. SCA4-21]WNF01587.1 hypothetical protein PS467_17205 [Streptomyces sp. SCA4-21]
MAVMLWLGLWGLDRGTMWRDESATYQMARRTLPQIRDTLSTVDAVHGLYYLLMHPVLAAWPTEVTMRLPSVLAAVAATGLVAALGCRLARPRVGLWAGLLYAATPVVTHYAQEGRSYALVAAGAAWATYLLMGAAGLAPRPAPPGRAAPLGRAAPGPAPTPGPEAASGPAGPVGRTAPPAASAPGSGVASGPAGATGGTPPGTPSRSAVPACGDVSPAPAEVPPACGDVPPACGDVSPACGDVSPACGDVSPACGDVPSACGDVSPVRGDVPPAPADVSPACGDVPSAPTDLPSACGDVPPASADVPPASIDVSPVRGDVPRLARAAPALAPGPASGPGPVAGPGGSATRARAAGWRWAAYGGVVAVTALLHVFAVLLLTAHALTLLLSRAPRRVWWGWGTAAAGAVVAVVPLAVLARRQSAQLAWMRPPTLGRLWAMAEEFAGPSALVLAGNLLLIAVALVRPRRGSLTAVALPLVCVPPVLLFALALYRPCFHERYLLFALAGVPLLAAAGADRLAGAVADRPRVSRAATGLAVTKVARAGVTGAGVAAAGVLAVGGAFVWQLPLHQWERQPFSRQDDLAALAATLGRLTRPGDPVLYDPPKERRIAIAYPRPLAGLRDIALKTPGPASGTLYGIDVGPAELLRRLDGTRSAWLIAADEPEAHPAKAATLTGPFRLAYSLCLPGVRLEHYVRVGPA